MFDITLTETFQCPVCSAAGANAESACDQNVKYEVCNRNNAVCQLTKKALESNMQLSVTRKCSDKQTFLEEREKCQRDANCLNTAMCAESFCMAPAPGRDFKYILIFQNGFRTFEWPAVMR